jgi:coproporphyrinogen III oxidase
MRQKMADMVHRIQDEICEALREIDGVDYRQDEWTREEGGGGRSRVFSGGKVFEKAGVNVSVVHGTLSPQAAKSMGGGHELQGADLDFFATGVSLVLHPINPMAPTVHANYRYFERGEGQKPGSWWFGGGADYFHIKHRGERRGLGGIFFDDINDADRDDCFAFVTDCAESFLSSYLPILARRKDLPYATEQKEWQQIRRGRYVEFNLVYDRGTTFGLTTNGRIESILMSLPLTARWEYCHEVESGTEEYRLLEVLRHPRDWLEN